METRSTSKAGPSPAGDDTGIEMESLSLSQFRDQFNALQVVHIAFLTQVIQIVKQLCPGSRPATTADGHEPNPTVSVATTDTTTPALEVPDTPIICFNPTLIDPLSPQTSFLEFLQWRKRWSDLCTMSGCSQFSRRVQLACQ